MEILQQIADFISGIDAKILVPLGLMLEFVFRLIPSKKPLSIMHLVGGAIRLVGNICVGVADKLDKLLPQKLK